MRLLRAKGLAYSGLAFNYVNQDDWFMSPNEAGPKTKDAAKRALAIDESDAGAHLSMAIVTHWYDWDWAAAEKEFQRAIELSPNYGEAHSYYSWFLAPMGDMISPSQNPSWRTKPIHSPDSRPTM